MFEDQIQFITEAAAQDESVSFPPQTAHPGLWGLHDRRPLRCGSIPMGRSLQWQLHSMKSALFASQSAGLIADF